MSAKYTFWAWGVKVKNAPLKLALLQLADNANDDGVSWYSVPKMANRCDMSERALQGHIKELVAAGLLSIKERPGTSRIYQLQYQEAQLIAPQILHHTPAEVAPPPPQILHHTPAEVADDPNNEPNNIDPVIEKHSLPSKLDDRVKQVIDLLNSMTGSKYKPSTKSHAGNISGRLNDGHSVDDLMAVVRFKVQEWLHDPKMAQYLRPETLFQAGKFNGYLTSAKATQGPLAGLSAISRKNAQNLAGWLNEE
ncbi:replication initiation protein [Aeromonas phage 51]|uniref:Replication initiation protein n=3 Tax=Popoffvirus pv56 TaxID=2560283 RepID=A0A219YBB6_9CAUD|nr:replication initiation protein [Aeromonas phage vB_AsaM-56]AFC22620.1 putative DnaA recombination protein [Aeromonas phage vB_AsaM-56]APU01247.1 replication initiation protein [Aeromonas phage 51]APU01331.1 replication initiation protein [Aeromonas phage 56]